MAVTLVVAGVGKWAERQEIEVYLGSFTREAQEAPKRGETRVLDVGGRGCKFAVDEGREVQMLELITAERARSGVGRLKADGEMTRAARKHAQDMVDKRYFSHYSPDSRDAGDRLKEEGVTFGLVGENLAYAANVRGAHRGLMGSETHRKNIIEPRFGRAAVGVLYGGKCGVVVVENFAD